MDDNRIAIVGYGGMGSNHGNYLWNRKDVNASGGTMDFEGTF